MSFKKFILLLVASLAFHSSFEIHAFDISSCGRMAIELKKTLANKLGQWRFTQSEMRNYKEIPFPDFLQLLAASQAPRDWIVELPIDWEAEISKLRSSDTDLKALAMIMRVFRDGEVGPYPDMHQIQENWITWGQKQADISVHDDHPHKTIARRAQLAFRLQFDQVYVSSDPLLGTVNSMRILLDVTSAGAVNHFARELKKISDDPEDINLANRALQIAETLAKRYLAYRFILTALEGSIKKEAANDRGYTQKKLSDHVIELGKSIEVLSNQLSMLMRKLSDKRLEAANVSMEIETPRGAEVHAQIRERWRNVQRSHDIGLVIAARAGDISKFNELLGYNLVPPHTVKDIDGKNLWEIAKDQPEILKALQKFTGEP